MVPVQKSIPKYGLFGGFSPFEKYQSNWMISPGWKLIESAKKKTTNKHTQKNVLRELDLKLETFKCRASGKASSKPSLLRTSNGDPSPAGSEDDTYHSRENARGWGPLKLINPRNMAPFPCGYLLGPNPLVKCSNRGVEQGTLMPRVPPQPLLWGNGCSNPFCKWFWVPKHLRTGYLEH